MKVYVLTYTVGLSSGFSELVGIYSTKEKAEQAKKRDMSEITIRFRLEDNYSIDEIELDKAINYTYADW